MMICLIMIWLYWCVNILWRDKMTKKELIEKLKIEIEPTKIIEEGENL